MRSGRRSTTFFIAIISICLAIMAGVAIPLLSGASLRTEPISWTPAPATAIATATATEPWAATTTSKPAAPATPRPLMPTQTVSVAVAATDEVSGEPALAATRQVTETAQATSSPTPASEPLAPTATAQAVEAGASQPEPTTQQPASVAEENGPFAEIGAEQLNLRLAPDADAPVVGLGLQGDRFQILGRDSSGLWLQACCVADEPIWLASGFVTVTGSIENVPIAP